jgi:hypothetical protein
MVRATHTAQYICAERSSARPDTFLVVVSGLKASRRWWQALTRAVTNSSSEQVFSGESGLMPNQLLSWSIAFTSSLYSSRLPEIRRGQLRGNRLRMVVLPISSAPEMETVKPFANVMTGNDERSTLQAYAPI